MLVNKTAMADNERYLFFPVCCLALSSIKAIKYMRDIDLIEDNVSHIFHVTVSDVDLNPVDESK